MEQLLTLREAAAIARVSEGTIRNWIRAGDLRAAQAVPRGRYRIAAEELEEILRPRRRRT
jgi:excisionase family DNA binding protein